MHSSKPVNSKPRHPLCPYCHYDMVASVDPVSPRFARCPECGEEIEPHEFAFTRRPGEWTEMIGLRNATISILVRVAIVAVLWALLLLGMDHVISMLLGPTGTLYARVLIIPLTIIGMSIGLIMITRLHDHAGFESWLVIWMAVGGGWLGLHLGQTLANSLFAMNYLTAPAWSVMVGVVSLCMSIYLAFHD